jgi:hypothetical protein
VSWNIHGLLRITRLIRILRIARLVRFVHSLRTLFQSIVSTLRQVVWAFVLLFGIIFMMSIVFAQAVKDHYTSEEQVMGGCGDLTTPLGRYWGSLPRAMLSLLMSISNGVSWIEVSEPLSNLGSMWVALFILYLMFTVFAVLNVITGVCCESAMESARRDHWSVSQQVEANKQLLVQQALNMFHSIDVDHSNEITLDELVEHLKSEQANLLFACMELDVSNAWELFNLMDCDEGGAVDIDEWVTGCLRLRGASKALEVANLAHNHKMFEKNTQVALEKIGTTLHLLAEESSARCASAAVV